MAEPIRILHVEDNRADVLLVKKALSAWSEQPFTLAHAARLAEALPYLVGDRVDVVLLDLTLPDSAGVSTVERIHVMSRDTPIVVFTGNDDEELGLDCIDAGAADYLCKCNVTPHTLRRSMSFALERRRQSAIDQLNDALARYEEIYSAADVVGAEAIDRGRLRTRNAELAGVIEGHYRELLEAFVEHVIEKTPKPTRPMTSVATSLGEIGASPRDLIDTHVRVVRQTMQASPKERARATAVTGRQMVLEMMGCLLDYYRAGTRRPSNPVEPPKP